jgi:hypothetical protein
MLLPGHCFSVGAWWLVSASQHPSVILLTSFLYPSYILARGYRPVVLQAGPRSSVAHDRQLKIEEGRLKTQAGAQPMVSRARASTTS